MNERPLHLIIIDAWHPGVLSTELAAGRLPAMQHLVRHGQLNLDCASIFPTVTPACLTSIATGVAPDQHGITGVFWFDRQSDRYVHYWPYPQSFMWGTIEHVIGDFFVRLNAEHLAPEALTIFELLEAADVPSACVNFPVSRAPYEHEVQVPWMIRMLGRLPKRLTLPGPRYMRHGDMLRGASPRGHLPRRYGFSDHHGALRSAELIRAERPSFMLTYLNENDLRSHHWGPENTGKSLRWIDAEIGLMMDAYGSWDRAVKEARWMLVGDHSQSNTYPGRSGHALNVFKAFPQHRVAPMRTGGLAAGGYDFAVSPNDRMCYVYLDPHKGRLRDDILELASGWPIVDQIFWRDGDEFHGYRRATGEALSWREGGPVADPYGRRWRVEGALGAVDATMRNNMLLYGDYPNALARVTQALSVRNGADVILTAMLGYEFTSGFPMGKGNHGSLHVQDTNVPLLTVGLSQPVLSPRITDLVPMILREFGVPVPEYMQPSPPPAKRA